MIMDWKDSLAGLLDQMPAASETPAVEPKARPKKKPRLKWVYEKRNGKPTTIIIGMENESDEDVNALAKTLKTRLAVGGSTRDGEILLQGDVRTKLPDLLKSLGY